MKNSIKIKLRIFGIIFSLFPFIHVTASDNTRYVLEKVVMLNRHGVRPQTDTVSLNNATGKKWPEWNVPDGFLSGHGYAGMVIIGAYQRAKWQTNGLTVSTHNSCPDAGQVWLWAAPDQRTKATGAALLDGMFPGCGLIVHSTENKHDPLFDTLEMGIAKPDQQKVYEQVIENMGSPQKAEIRYRAAVTELRRAVCDDNTKSCAFLDKKWGVVIDEKGKVQLTGPVSIGAPIAETIRLQYSENLPLQQVAFGHAKNAQQVQNLMALHAAKYDLLNNTTEYSWHGGSLLMRQLLNSLIENSISSQNIYPEMQNKIVIFVGHDTNISLIRNMLDFNWKIPGYPRNDIPPGGSLVMERYRDNKSKDQFVHITFSAMTLDQWRHLSPLNIHNPLPSVEFKSKNCRHTIVGVLCPLDYFVKHIEKRLVDDGKNISLFR